jgi:hypothetical protein
MPHLNENRLRAYLPPQAVQPLRSSAISQIRTLSVERIGKLIGKASAEEVGTVIDGLNEIIGAWQRKQTSGLWIPRQRRRFLIGCDSGDDMADPTQKTTGADPQTGGDEQPENSTPEMAIIKLPHTRNQEAQHCGITGTCHVKSFFS